MSTNPFMDLATNPFVAPEAQISAVVPLPPCGVAGCKRSHRPNGEHYSSDRDQRALELKADGKIGPQFGSLGGARKTSRKRAAEVVAEAAAEHAEKIKQVFLDGIDDTNPIGVRLQAAKELLKVESDDMEREVRERQAEFDNMNKEQLVDNISEMLERLARAGAIASEVEGMIAGSETITDAEVVDD